MTKLLDRAVEAARSLSPDAQDDIARVVLQLAGDEQAIAALTPDEEVQAVWSKHGV